MKLSFSTKGWKNTTWQEFVSEAVEAGFSGIEIHDINAPEFSEKTGPANMEMAAATVRNLIENKLSIPCIDVLCDIGNAEKLQNNIDETASCIAYAKALKVPFIRIHAPVVDNDKNVDTAVFTYLEKAVPMAEAANITLLMETAGIYSDTKKLCSLLNRFACDNLAVLWDVHHTYRDAKEAPDQTVTNLGAYIKHVHFKDSEETADGLQYCLIGEGTLPVDEIHNALRTLNYAGFISLEWDPEWMPDLQDPSVIFSHFVSYMSLFEQERKTKSHLYDNQAHTGKFVWKKESLVNITFPQLLDKMVEEFPDQYMFKFTTLDYTRTYAQFRDDVDEFARVLISMGVKAGTHVTAWATNLPQWYIAFWAVTKIGAVLIPMNTAYKIHEAEYILRQSDTHTLIMIDGFKDSNYKEIIQELCPELENLKPGEKMHSARLPFLRNVITIGFRMKGCLEWNEALSRADLVSQDEVNRMAAAIDIHDVCNMQYTSGTTGFPKGVMLTHYNVINDGKCIGDRMDLSTADRMMIQVPMVHCFGMVLSMTASVTHGSTMMPIPYFSPKSSLACIHNERITVFNGVPTMFNLMFTHPDFAKTDFSYMRTGIMAGANCPPELMRKAAAEMNMTGILSVYGLTEASPGCTMGEVTESLDDRVETVGKAFPYIECKNIDPATGEDVPDGVNGEFVVRGYNVMKGYYKMPKATAEAIDKDGWLHSGDLCCRDERGYYKVTGRLKDMIIRGGENIYPREIEELILTNPKVHDVQVIGIPDVRFGEEIMACVILKKGETCTEDEMKKFVDAHMAKHKVPRYVHFMNDFPMNVAGKILKYKMREQAVERLKAMAEQK